MDSYTVSAPPSFNREFVAKASTAIEFYRIDILAHLFTFSWCIQWNILSSKIWTPIQGLRFMDACKFMI